jgi:hypothetical protein
LFTADETFEMDNEYDQLDQPIRKETIEVDGDEASEIAIFQDGRGVWHVNRTSEGPRCM